MCIRDRTISATVAGSMWTPAAAPRADMRAPGGSALSDSDDRSDSSSAPKIGMVCMPDLRRYQRGAKLIPERAQRRDARTTTTQLSINGHDSVVAPDKSWRPVSEGHSYGVGVNVIR